MKKSILIISLILFFPVVVMSQAPAKSFIVDTVITPYYEFDYMEWVNSDPHHPLLSSSRNLSVTNPNHPSWGYVDFTGDLLQYNYVERDVDVYGIAVWGHLFGSTGNRFTTPMFPPDTLFLYEATPDTFQLMEAVVFDNTDTNALIGWVYQPRITNVYYSCLDSMNDTFNRNGYYCWNFYFDKPVRVADSFYVGASDNTGFWIDWYIERYENHIDEPLPELVYPYYGVFGTNFMQINYDSTCWMPFFKKKVRINRLTDNWICRSHGLRLGEWGNHEQRLFWMIVPLIATYDTTWIVDTPACTPVYRVRMLSRFGNTIMLQWDHDGTHEEWQLSYGPQGTPPDSGTMVDCTVNRWQYEDTGGVPMVAYVRTVCSELDTIRYSDWSEGFEWFLSPFDISVDETGDVASQVTLRPNPATEWVDMLCPLRVTGVDVYGMDGVLQYRMQEGVSGFAVRDWAKGTYLLVVHTAAGRVTKKLVVE